MKPTSNITSTHKIEKLCIALGISITSLLLPTNTTAAEEMPMSNDDTLISQSSKKAGSTSKREVKEIQSVVNKAIRTGNIRSALKGTSLSNEQKNALLKLTKSDLQTIGRMQSKLAPMKKGTIQGAWVGVGIF